MLLNSHISAYARCLAGKVCGLVRSTWGTSQGEDKLPGITIAHTALCPLTVSPMSLSWLPAGITVTYAQSNGDGVPATVISASECGQYMSIKQPRNQGMACSPQFVPTRSAVRARCK